MGGPKRRPLLFAAAAATGAALLMALGFAPASSASPLSSRAVSADHARSAALVVQPCSDMAAIASCVMGILAPAGGTHGVYLKQAGGPVLAAVNDNVPYEPASSIKPLIGLYAMTQVEFGRAQLSEQIPKLDTSGGPDDCPKNTFSGTESLGNALQQMLQVSDNNRTDELMQFFGVNNLNNFAKSLGLTNTMFHTAASAPGFNVIGCLAYGYNPIPDTVDGNTMSLHDVATLWRDIARLPAPYAATFYELAAGRDMANTQGYDFTGIWPSMQGIASQEAPASLSSAQVQSFVDHMTVSVKGGNYQITDCVGACKQATWWVFAGSAEIPVCHGSRLSQTQYTWGYFISDAPEPGAASNPDTTVAGTAFFNASGQLLAAPIATGLANWASCAPTVTPTLALAKRFVFTTSRIVGVNRILATVFDSDRTDIAADLVGTINWGDGSTTSFASLPGGHGQFTVRGWHAYAAVGNYSVTITVKDVESGKSATVTDKIFIA